MIIIASIAAIIITAIVVGTWFVSSHTVNLEENYDD